MKLFALICLISISWAGTVHAQVMTDYCINPPYVTTAANPNLVLMIDNSASMYDIYYTYPGTQIDIRNCSGVTQTVDFAATSASVDCFDNSYDNTKTYVGYFEAVDPNGVTANYAYNWDNRKFVFSAMPGACNHVSLGYLCVDKDVATGTLVTRFVASGSFLNWLTASKFDIEKDILTGGKFVTKACSNSFATPCIVNGDCPIGGFCAAVAKPYLQAESRGCAGRRFLKTLPPATGIRNISFAVRGPTYLDPDNINPDTQGGMSRLEVYFGDNCNYSKCLYAVQQWGPGGNFGQAQTAVKDCLGVNNLSVNTAQQDANNFTHALQTCWKMKENRKAGKALWDGLNTTELKGDCAQAYKQVNGSFPGASSCSDDCTWGGANDCCYCDPDEPRNDRFASEANGSYLCTSRTDHPVPVAPYNNAYSTVVPAISCGEGNFTFTSVNTTGFLGKCAHIKKSKSGLASRYDLVWDENCVMSEIEHYCMGAAVSEVTDPSIGVGAIGDNVPAVVMDAGVNALGKAAATMAVRVDVSAPPKGIINDFEKRIRFGASSFNIVGSKTEQADVLAGSNIPDPKRCSIDEEISCRINANCPAGQTCSENRDDMDGGYILVEVGNSIGNHTTERSLIKVIDDIKARTWTPFSEGFYNLIGYYADRDDLKFNAADNGLASPSLNLCQTNNVLLITDGMSTADLNKTVRDTAASYPDPNDTERDDALNVNLDFAGSRNIDDIAWLAQNRNIYDFGEAPDLKSERIYTYVVFSGKDTGATNEYNPAYLMKETAENGGGTYELAQNPEQLQTALENAFEAIAARASSGTAASVLASGEGQGANLIQAVFYPTKVFENDVEVKWTGRLHNIWYYVDPFFKASSIREDSTVDKKLALGSDYIVITEYKNKADAEAMVPPQKEGTFAFLYKDANGDGAADSATPSSVKPIEEISHLWEAGELLWKRDVTTDARTIYTTTDSKNLIPFSTDKVDVLRPLLGTDIATRTSAENKTSAENLIKYMHGWEIADYTDSAGRQKYRSRNVTIGGVGPHVYKLGDILNSTPKLSSWVPLNHYYTVYGDTTYSGCRQFSRACFTEMDTYFDRGLAFAGANDGMLHAFKLGMLNLPDHKNPSQTCAMGGDDKACMAGSDLGKEVWAYIPKNVLPYLKYFKENNYCHIYTVDLSPYIVDASIGGGPDATRTKDTWRTILIGGMRLGGACRNHGDGCTDCVKAPGADLNGDGEIEGDEEIVGLSTYFALDITDQDNPKLLWEFSDPELGLTSTGPAIVRIKARKEEGGVRVTDDNKNGKFFIVFGSGPTGPIDPVNQNQFLGRSDQSLRLFILDLESGSLLRTINTGIGNAFAGSMLNTMIDVDMDYQDDVVYIGYTSQSGATWTDGGVIRLSTNEDDAGALDPANWTVSRVMDNAGPVTTSIQKLVSRSKGLMWVYFGTGRFFYKHKNGLDDPDTGRTLYGLKDPCYSLANGFDGKCTGSVSGTIKDVTSIATGLTEAEYMSAGIGGWKINLDGPSGDLKAERVITDPLATSSGLVFFTTFKPYKDICDIGGQSHLWAVRYSTGGAPGALLKGKGLVQVSTGSIEQIDLSKAFTEKGGRRTVAMEGVPPTAQGLSLLGTPPPVKRVLHIRER